MIRRPPRSTLFPYTDALPISNKIRGVRAALAHDEVTARRAREHNHCNVLCLGTDLLSEDQIRKIVEIFLDRKSTRLNSSHANISYAVFCLKKKNIIPMSYSRL